MKRTQNNNLYFLNEFFVDFGMGDSGIGVDKSNKTCITFYALYERNSTIIVVKKYPDNENATETKMRQKLPAFL